MKIYLYSIIIVITTQFNAFCDETAERKQLNDAMAERAEIMVKSYQAKVKLEKSWSDKAITSPEIEKLRKQYQNLSFEMNRVREQLKAEVRKLPQMQKRADEVKAMRVKQEELEKKIIDLKKQQ